ncbi:ATP-binding cassette domain-containing protein [Streptomyces acidiscabies]|uniref:ATP-binding cassette domain-containing protein n=1 Tax=Streptomyces acidiscabies TaxID=42234 RepID=UPI0002ECBA0A
MSREGRSLPRTGADADTTRAAPHSNSASSTPTSAPGPHSDIAPTPVSTFTPDTFTSDTLDSNSGITSDAPGPNSDIARDALNSSPDSAPHLEPALTTTPVPEQKETRTSPTPPLPTSTCSNPTPTSTPARTLPPPTKPTPPPAPNSDPAPNSLLPRALHYLLSHRTVLLRLTLWSLLEAGQTFLLGYALAKALDEGFLAGRVGVGMGWLGVAGAGVIAGTVGTGRVYRCVADLVEPLRDRLVTGVVRRGVRDADRGALSGLTQQVEIARDTFAGLVMVSRSFVFTSVGALVGLFSLAPALLIVVLPPLAAGVALFALTLRPLARRQEAYLRADEALAAHLGTVCPGLRDITAAGAERDVEQSTARLIDAEFRASRALARWSVTRVIALAIGGELPVVLLLLTTPWLLTHDVTPGALLGAFAYVTQSLLPALNALVHGLGTSGSRLTVVLRRLTANTPPAPDPTPAPAPLDAPHRTPPRPPGTAAHKDLPRFDSPLSDPPRSTPPLTDPPRSDPPRFDPPLSDPPRSTSPLSTLPLTDPPLPNPPPTSGAHTPTAPSDPTPPSPSPSEPTPTPTPEPEQPETPPSPTPPPSRSTCSIPTPTPTPASPSPPPPERPPPPTHPSPPPQTSRPTPAPTLTLTNLTFAYGPASTPVLDHLSLTLPPGAHLTVVGPSGIGKSTLTALIAATLTPTEGEIKIGGRAAPDAKAHRVLIPQEAYVFTGTLAENLTHLCPDPVPEDELWAGAEAVGMAGLMRTLGGPHAPVDPAALSTGERQLIALTRAYLSPAPLALLDEATSHLDPAAEERAERAFAERPGTLIVVAHRIASARRADRVLVMDGANTAYGTHGELLESSPLYRDLVGRWSASS